MKNALKLTVLAMLVACCLVVAAVPTHVLTVRADSAENEYYVCLSNENYRIRNANKMQADGSEYFLSDVSLSSAVTFYVQDLSGTKYYAQNGDEFKVAEAGVYRYIIKFSPTAIYDVESDGYAQTDCHITYKFYAPDSVTAIIDDGATSTNVEMTYNNYQTAYDLYYISSIPLEAGSTVTVDAESHTVDNAGNYRILYTPGKTVNGNNYLFNGNGVYGSGDGYEYHIYIEDAPEYYVATENDEIVNTAAIAINGKSAYRLERYENNVTLPEYRGAQFFAVSTDYNFKYYLYEKLVNGTYQLVDDDNNADTTLSKIVANHVGWYTVAFVDGGSNYTTTLIEKTYDFNGWYLLGSVNHWGYTDQGALDLDENDKFTLLEENDADYNEDYDQYRLTITVTESDLKQGDFEFYITDGETKYMNLTDYIVIDTAGTYDITFSNEHVYGRGRNYYYTLLAENRDMQEVLIGSTADWVAFAQKCNASYEYSRTAEVYLTSDLDFVKTTFVPIELFGGIWHGGYHVLKNITIDGEQNVYNVFGTLTTGATVERLVVENLQISAKDQDYVGFVGRNYGTLNDITVQGKIKGEQFVGAVVAYNGRTAETTGSTQDVYIDGKVSGCVASATVEGFVNVGGICGYSDGKIEQSQNQGTIAGKSTKINTAPVNLGGIVGYSSGRITACENLGAVQTDGSSVNVGGIVGLCTGEIYYAFNRADVTGTKYVGGVVGYYGTVSQNEQDLTDYFGGITFEDFVDYYTEDEGSYEQVDGRVHLITYAVNNGNIKGKSNVGGIVGYTELAFTLSNAVSDGNVTVTAGNYAGGIVGLGTNVVVKGSLSAGTISAKGTNSGNYVGGILGAGKSVQNSMSSATLLGSDYVGGIAGEITGELKSCYTNVLIIANENAHYIGDIAGHATNYNDALGNFNGEVANNYYVGTVGGVAQKEYGQGSDYAATAISSEKLASVGIVSPYLNSGFLSDAWIGGASMATYPVLNYLENVQMADEYGDDEGFIALFANYPELESYAEKYARITYVVGFLEWSQDNGDLYDDDGILQKDNFDLIDYVRVYQGDQLSAVPAFKYAETNQGVSVYQGNQARYFVTFNVPEEINSNLNIYADYQEIATTLTDEDGKILVEGTFDADTQVALKTSPLGYYLEFTLHDQVVDVDKCTVKFFIGDNAKDYEVVLSATGEKIATEVSGKYLKFDVAANQAFTVEQVAKTSLPNWAWLLIGLGCGVVGVVIAVAVTCKIKKSKQK